MVSRVSCSRGAGRAGARVLWCVAALAVADGRVASREPDYKKTGERGGGVCWLDGGGRATGAGALHGSVGRPPTYGVTGLCVCAPVLWDQVADSCANDLSRETVVILVPQLSGSAVVGLTAAIIRLIGSFTTLQKPFLPATNRQK